ncbi:cytochrome P450 family protein [Medicago truncatula]|uniref:Cytochrome P450 family protein n=2 Tax=Medicago truncatula TaxID=3880 RepID=A0A072TX78_MEDTR|nr:cytochrome P450 family protein [Medicago truncatula]
MGEFITFFLSFQPLTFIFFLLFYITLIEFRRVKKLVGTGPTTYPVIGCLISFYKNRFRLLDWYTKLLAQSPTNTILVQRLGARRTIVTANQHNVEYVLKTNFKNFPKGKPFREILSDFLGKGIFNVDDDLWMIQRKLASHEFSLRSINEFIMHTLEEEVKGKLIPLMDSLSIENKVVDFQELLGRFSFNVVCKFTLGIDDDDDNRCCLDPCFPISPLAKAFDVAAEISARRGAAPLFLVWRVKKWLGVGSERRLRDAVKEVKILVMEMILERKKMMNVKGEELVGGQDLLSRLISSGHEEEVIRDMVISFIMAGRDTTSSALTWFFWLLSRYSDIEHKILKESENKLNNETLDYESLKNMNFLKACLCESMRLYPPIAWDSKHATCDDVLPDGTLVKCGDRVTYFPYGMGRMENLWGKDWFEFRPDRWFVELNNEIILSEVCPYKFPIFQAGPRVCLGKEMAFIQMKYVVASILRRFRIKIVSDKKPIFVPLLTAHMAGGLKVLVSKRMQL